MLKLVLVFTFLLHIWLLQDTNILSIIKKKKYTKVYKYMRVIPVITTYNIIVTFNFYKYIYYYINKFKLW